MKSVVVHLITGLDTGGAEVMLFRLLTTIDQQRFHSQVISLTNVGAMGERIRQLGIPVQALGMRPGVPHPLAVLRLSRWLRQSKPALVQTWMYHADLIGGLAAWLADVPVVWNIRHSDLNPAHIKRSTIWVARVCAWLSRWLPAAIVVNSENAKRIHVGMGYRHEKMVFIPNGFDLEQFQPDPPLGCALRRQLDLEDGVPVVGMAARYHPQKDHRTFVQAATLLCERMPEARFLLCGAGMVGKNAELVGLLHQAGVHNHFHLLDLRDEMISFYNALDLLSSSSASGEGFPQVVGEAMACGVPCVVTDVGDSALIVGGTGRVVPPCNPVALAAAWEEMLRMPPADRTRLGQTARQRIQENFSIEKIAGQYEALYSSILAEGRA